MLAAEYIQRRKKNPGKKLGIQGCGCNEYTDSSFVLTVASIITISSKGCVTPVNENSVATELHKGQ